MSHLSVLLGAQNPAQALGFLLSAAECPAYLNHHAGIRQVNGKVPHFGDNQPPDGPLSELLIKLAALTYCSFTGNQRIVVVLCHPLELIQVHTDDE